MPKKNVVLKAALSATDKEAVVAFNKTVVTIMQGKLEKLDKPSGKRKLVKITSGNKVTVSIDPAIGYVKVNYTVNGEVYFDKQFTSIDDFKAEIAAVEEKI